MASNPDPNILILVIQDLRIGKWTAAGSLAMFYYDVLLTLEEEYRYVWKSRWGIGKVLYLLVRYPFLALWTVVLYAKVAPSTTLSLTFCRMILKSDVFLGWVEILLVQIILALRTAALYNMKLGIVILLAGLVMVCSGSRLAIFIWTVPRLATQHFPISFPGQRGCYNVCLDCHALHRLVLLPIVIFDSSVFFLTLNKHIQHSKRMVNTTLFHVLYRDGFIYFATIFSCTLTTYLVWNTARITLGDIMPPVMRNIVSMMCARLLLNLRGALLPERGSHTTRVSQSHAFQFNYDASTDFSRGIETRIGDDIELYENGADGVWPHPPNTEPATDPLDVEEIELTPRFPVAPLQ